MWGSRMELILISETAWQRHAKVLELAWAIPFWEIHFAEPLPFLVPNQYVALSPVTLHYRQG